MQLAYIWIENYLNLQNCGFLFSSRIRIQQTTNIEQRTFLLSINDNEKYIPELFGTNIIEVSAIIGANGVGKSNLIEYLTTFLQTKSFYEENWVAILFDSKTNSFHIVDALFKRIKTKTSAKKVIKSWKLKIENKSNYKVTKPTLATSKTFFSMAEPYISGKFASELKGSVLYYSPFLDFRNYSEISGYTTVNDISTNYLIEHDADDQHSENDKVEIHKYKNVERQFTFVQENMEFVKDVKFPTEVVVRFAKLVDNDEIRKDDHGFRTRDFYKKLRDSASSKWNQVPNHLMDQGRKKGSMQMFEKGKKIKVKWWFAINFVTNFLHNYSYIVDLHDNKFKVSPKLEEFDFKNDDPVVLVKKFFSLHKFIPKEKFDPIAFIEYVCKVIETEADVTSIDEDNESWFNVKPETAKSILSQHRQYLKCFEERTGRRGFLHLDWRNMSSGEKAFLDIFSRIYWGLERMNLRKGNLVYLLLDEGEAGFHPLWQRKYFSYLLKFLANFTDYRFHIILTTHSPFIVSDLPTENLLLLQKDDHGNCRVANKFNSIEESFAANIHNLLADAFFMNEGPIGEFASNVINNLFKIDSQQANQSIIKIKKLINTIGEPLIKVKLHEKFLQLYEELPEEQRLEMEITNLTDRLNKLKKKTDD